VPTVKLMVARSIFRAVLPEIETADRLAALVAAEAAAGSAPVPVRRLASLLPAGAEVSASVAARLRLSKRAAKRLVSAADPARDSPELLAYWIGNAHAVDRFLLAGETGIDLRALETWQHPRLAVSGGDLIAMGLEAGPVVAATLRAIERDWAAAGFTSNAAAVRALARRHVDQALRGT
jgi:poly(A) polymerase